MLKINDALVSIIVPIYNVKDYLDDCLASIISQTYKNIEIILVDDGSTDESGEMCDNWLKKDKRIEVVHKKNGGLNYARRDGFRKATGKYITFVDSDDVIASTYVETLVSVLESKNVDASITGIKNFTKTSQLEFNISKNTKSCVAPDSKESLGWLIEYNYPINDNLYIMTVWGKLYRKEVVDKIDWKFSNYRANEDEFWTMQAFSNLQNGVALTDTNLYGYRQNPKSITRDVYKNFYNGKKINKFQFIEHLYIQSTKYLGPDYEGALARRLGANLVDFVDIYAERGVMNLKNMISAQSIVNKFYPTILEHSFDDRVRRKIGDMKKRSVPVYVYRRKKKATYLD